MCVSPNSLIIRSSLSWWIRTFDNPDNRAFSFLSFFPHDKEKYAIDRYDDWRLTQLKREIIFYLLVSLIDDLVIHEWFLTVNGWMKRDSARLFRGFPYLSVIIFPFWLSSEISNEFYPKKIKLYDLER